MPTAWSVLVRCTDLARVSALTAAFATAALVPAAAQTRLRFYSAVPVAVDGQVVYAADPNGVHRVDVTTGRFTTIAPGDLARLWTAVVVSRGGGLLLLNDKGITRVTPADGRTVRVATDVELRQGASGPWIPLGLAEDARGGVLVLSIGRLVRLDPVSRAVAQVPLPALDPDATFTDIASDPAGHVYVAHTGYYAPEDRILRLDAVTGAVSTAVGPGTPVRDRAGVAQPRVEGPSSLAWDPRGGLVFCDATRVLRFDPATGDVRVVAAFPAKGDWFDVAVAADGTIVLSDELNMRLWRLGPATGRWSVVVRGDAPGRTRRTRSDTRFPAAPDETCRNEPGDAELIVSLVNEVGAAIPGAHVWTLPGEQNPKATYEITNDRGEARLRWPTSGARVIVGALEGFHPATRGVSVSASCTARLRLRLAICCEP
jgi:streptogramin lyase